MDGFTLLSAAPGACLTNALRLRLHAGPPQTHGRQPPRSKEHQGCATQSLHHLYNFLFFVFFLHICFSSDSCTHLIFRRPRQHRVTMQILQVVCCSIDYLVIIDFMWRPQLKKDLQKKLQMKHRSKVKMLKWPSDKLQRPVPKNINMCHIRHSHVPGGTAGFP